MKFAVVEYMSKSGAVWRHTPEHPNYLADPQREIDPTSFGCYVSALAGEHVPLTGLILGPVESVAPLQRFYRRVHYKLRGRWPNYSLDYLSRFEVLLVVHQLSNAAELVRTIRRLRTLYPQMIILGVPTQPFGIIKHHVENDADSKQQLVNFMDACHLFLTIAQENTEWYQRLTKTPVTYVPQPYPTDFATRAFKPRAEKLKSIFVAGVTQRDSIKKGQVVARRLQEEFPDYHIVVPKVGDLDYDASELTGARYTVVAFEEWQRHLTTLAQTTLVINTDYTYTRGRVQVDCAAVGTPSLGSNSDGQRDLWPKLYADRAESPEALVATGRRLLNDTAYYESLVAEARAKLTTYSYQAAADRIQRLVMKVRDSKHVFKQP